MVIDFGLIKREVGQWVDHHWDHTAILWREDDDPAVAHIIESNRRYGREVYLLTDPPTAEHIACELALIAQRLLASAGIIVVQVTVAETPNGSATWKREADKREVDERRTP
jgi:6-pyruvoyl-tetrahydropterin synthase